MAFWTHVAEIDDHPVTLVGNQAVASVLSFSFDDSGQVARIAVPGNASGVLLVFSVGLYGYRPSASCPQGS